MVVQEHHPIYSPSKIQTKKAHTLYSAIDRNNTLPAVASFVQSVLQQHWPSRLGLLHAQLAQPHLCPPFFTVVEFWASPKWFQHHGHGHFVLVCLLLAKHVGQARFLLSENGSTMEIDKYIYSKDFSSFGLPSPDHQPTLAQLLYPLP